MRLGPISSFAALAAVLSSFTTAAAQERAVFLLDRSGSMNFGTPTRCDRAQAVAREDVAKFLTEHPSALVSVREFGEAIPGQSRFLGPNQWIGNITDAQAAVDAASGCSGLTALADAICDSVLALQLQSPSECTLYVYTDGGENNSGGACSGPSAVNASTGCCPFDPFCTQPFLSAADGSVSWQQNACTIVGNLAQVCDTVVNTYEFGDFPLGGVDPGFQFLESLSRGTGGAWLRIDDTVPEAPPTYVRRTGCESPGIGGPILEFQNVTRLGDLFTIIHSAPPGYDRWISLSAFAHVPPLDLTTISAPGCKLGIGPQFSLNSALLPFIVPFNPSLVGLELHVQGLAFDASLGLNPGWMLTTNTYTFRIVM